MESPEYVKMSLATAISLGLMRGRMYRAAVNRCVNLLVHYPEGCSARCAYCGLSRGRPGAYQDKSFIHVSWPLFRTNDVMDAIISSPPYVQRVCVSMITNGKCPSATIGMARMLKEHSDLPISILVAPTVIDGNDLMAMRDAGADKIGVAVDLATEKLFDRYRGRGVNGPHKWEKYWEILEAGLRIFGSSNVGAHLMVGMGETEREMVIIMDKLWRMGVVNHLFSFFAEEGSGLADRPQPPWPSYLRVQLARYLMEEGLGSLAQMDFDEQGSITGFGLSSDRLTEIVNRGLPFMTTGCLGPDGQVACNRPFGNCLPEKRQWNYPYQPNEEELELIRGNIFGVE